MELSELIMQVRALDKAETSLDPAVSRNFTLAEKEIALEESIWILGQILWAQQALGDFWVIRKGRRVPRMFNGAVREDQIEEYQYLQYSARLKLTVVELALHRLYYEEQVYLLPELAGEPVWLDRQQASAQPFVQAADLIPRRRHCQQKTSH